MQRLLGFSLLLLSITAAAQSETPAYETSRCPNSIRRLAQELEAEISCGSLAVPEDRRLEVPDRQLELFVVRVAARQPAGKAPLLFLGGGPGAAVSARIPAILGSPLQRQYDVIAIDQRGAGFSRPSLNCHEADDRQRDSRRGWIRECHQRLVADGIALDAVNSANFAADIHDLLVALQIEKANVYGESYGSRLALTLARDFPQRIRALILDGVLPLQVKRLEAQASNGYRAMAQLIADCGSDRACNRAYPNLRQSLLAAVRRLNREPARFDQADLPYPVVMTGDDFVAQIIAMLGLGRLIPTVPAFVDAVAAGAHVKDLLLEALAREAGSEHEAGEFASLDDLSEGAWLSVRCIEEAPFNSRDEIVNQAAHLPDELRRALVTVAIAGINECKWWDVPRAPDRENQPVQSDIPTLLLSGRYDPITPPAWGDEAAQYLENSWHYVFPDRGHGTLFESAADCAESIALSFLANPQRQPADSCIKALAPPDFVQLDS